MGEAKSTTLQAKRREENEKLKRDFFFPQKFSRSEKKGRVGLQLAPTDMHTNKEPPRRISEVLKVAAEQSYLLGNKEFYVCSAVRAEQTRAAH